MMNLDLKIFDFPMNRQSLFIKNLFHSKLSHADSLRPHYADLFEQRGEIVGWNHATELTYMFHSRLIHAGYVIGFNAHDSVDKTLHYDVVLNETGAMLYEQGPYQHEDLNILFKRSNTVSYLPEKEALYKTIFDNKSVEFHEPEMVSQLWLTMAMYALQTNLVKFSIRKHRSHDFLIPVVSRLVHTDGSLKRIFAWAIFSHYYSANVHARNLIKTPISITCVS